MHSPILPTKQLIAKRASVTMSELDAILNNLFNNTYLSFTAYDKQDDQKKGSVASEKINSAEDLRLYFMKIGIVIKIEEACLLWKLHQSRIREIIECSATDEWIPAHLIISCAAFKAYEVHSKCMCHHVPRLERFKSSTVFGMYTGENCTLSAESSNCMDDDYVSIRAVLNEGWVHSLKGIGYNVTYDKLVMLQEYRQFIYERMDHFPELLYFKDFSWLSTNSEITELYKIADLNIFLDEFMYLEELSPYKESIDFYNDLQTRMSLFSSNSNESSLSDAVLPYLRTAVGSKIYNLKIDSLNHYLIVDLNKYITFELETMHQLKISENSNLIHDMTEFYSSILESRTNFIVSKVIEPLRTDFDKENIDRLISEIHSIDDDNYSTERSSAVINKTKCWVGIGLDVLSIVLSAAAVPLFSVPVLGALSAGGAVATQIVKDRWFSSDENEKKISEKFEVKIKDVLRSKSKILMDLSQLTPSMKDEDLFISLLNATRNITSSVSNSESNILLIRNYLIHLKVLLTQLLKKFDDDNTSAINRKLENLIESLSIMIDASDQISNYEQEMRSMNYLAAITQPSTLINIEPTVDSTIRMLNNAIKKSTASKTYKIVHKTLMYHIFPFVNDYLYELNYSGNSTLDTDLTILRLEQLQTRLMRSEIGVHSEDVNKHKFEDNTVYVWKYDDYAEAIDSLLDEKKVVFTANIQRGLDVNALKFNVIGIRFRTQNITVQREIDAKLRNFNIVMAHLGHSQYRCENKVFAIPGEKYIFKYRLSKSTGSVSNRNNVYEKFKIHSPILSPYAAWSFQLTSVPGNNETLAQYKTKKLDLVLKASGTYVDRDDAVVRLCEDHTMENFYKLEREDLHQVNSESQQTLFRYRRNIGSDKDSNTNIGYELPTSICSNGTLLLMDFIVRLKKGINVYKNIGQPMITPCSNGYSHALAYSFYKPRKPQQ